MVNLQRICFILLFSFGISFSIYSGEREIDNYTSTEKPWLWWYWMGSAVTPEGIDWHLQQFKEMGYGGVSIAATYGVEGNEANDIPFMSPRWINMLNYTATQFRKEGLGVDASLTSAWPFGGPNVTPEMAARYSVVKRLFSASPGEKVTIDLDTFNKGEVAALSAYNENGEYLDLTPFVSEGKVLSYHFPDSRYEVFGLFSNGTNQRTKRSGKGGEGLVLDHFSRSNVEKYLQRYDSLFAGNSNVRGTFNDSYEVYGADFSAVFLTEFEQRRGYDLRRYLYLLESPEKSTDGRRVLCDYRETISDLLLENFMQVWKKWATAHGVRTVEQAHGTPANWLDLYAAADIPQTESFGGSDLRIKNVRTDALYNEKAFGRPDKMLLKFASSASHVTGKKLTSSESATWLGDHFKVALSQAKPQFDELFISGINHVMLTCGAYSPQEIPFPGWHFYPAADFGHTSAFREVMESFSLYIARSQQLLQNSKPDNEVLLYLPVHDLWTECMDEDGRSKLMMFTIHNPDNWFYRQDIGDIARTLKREGFDFDYVSDRQLRSSSAYNGSLITEGGTTYKTVVVPCCKRIPLATLEQLNKLAKQGVNILFAYRMPTDVPGWGEVEERRAEMKGWIEELKNNPAVTVTPHYTDALRASGLRKERFGENNLEYIRKVNETGVLYFVANQANEFEEGWVELGTSAVEAVLFDPVSGRRGAARLEEGKIYLQLKPGESCFIQLTTERYKEEWNYFRQLSSSCINGKWKVSFGSGYPEVNSSYMMDQVGSWTTLEDESAPYFSGTGSYETTFDLPGKKKSGKYRLSLGDVREVADVWVNNTYIGRSWSVPFELDLPSNILRSRNNQLRVEVRNLDANRIIHLEKQGVKWRNFFMVDVAYRNFDTSRWESVPSGILGPVELQYGE